MLSQTTEYALRLVVQLASERDRPVTIPELARATKIPSGYLAKVLRQLSRAGLVHSQRGPNGGSVLLRPPEEVTVLDVVQAEGTRSKPLPAPPQARSGHRDRRDGLPELIARRADR